MSMDATNSRLQAALDLCETLLVPGGKARLSPYLADWIPEQERFLIPVYQSVMLDLLHSGYLPDEIRLIDCDSPGGLGAVAAVDALFAWQTACEVYEISSNLSAVRVLTLDRQPLQVYATKLAQRAGQLTGLSALVQTIQWLSTNTGFPLQASNLVLCTFPWQKNYKVKELLDRLPNNAILAALAWQSPGIRPEQLFDWRYQLLRERNDLVALGPCGQEYGRQLPAACQTCWHGQRAEVHISGAEPFTTPAWSYVLLLKQTAAVESISQPVLTVADLALPEIENAYARYIGVYQQVQVVQEQEVEVAEHPDQFQDNPADKKWREYIKLCPGQTGVKSLEVEERAGMSKPPLRYGQWIHLQRVRPRQMDPTRSVLALFNEVILNQRPVLPMRETFIAHYTPAIRAAVDEVAHRLFGFEALRPFQHQVLERVLCGKDIFAIAATGGGKSECYILPAMLLPGLTVVVSPLKSLMQDQYDQRMRERYGLDYLTTTLNSDVKFYERQGRLRRVVLGHFKLLYVTPEQLERGYVLDALRQADRTVGVRYLALDEAHCISQWGHDFRPSYLNIVERLRDYGLSPHRVALTATASPLVRDDVCQELRLDKRSVDEGGDVLIDTANRPELNLVVRRVRTAEEKAHIIVSAVRQLQEGSAIVFMPHTGGSPDNPNDFGPPASAPDPDNAGMVSTGVSGFARYLSKQLGQPVALYHGAMDNSSEFNERSSTAGSGDQNDGEQAEMPTSRQAEQRAFMRGEKRIMVATKGFGMGIDKPDIRLVIHRSPTANLEAYAQEAGRAGRDGKQATVMLLFSRDKPTITKASPKDYLPRNTLQSDLEIQEFFTEQRYVRRMDIEALVAFLRTPQPLRVNSAFYFTSDQVMDMLEACTQDPGILGLAQPYQWPKFPPRQRTGTYESPEHKRILDRGHLYKTRRDYINRILKVLYNNRPTINGQIVPLISAAHETSIVLRDFHLYKPEQIVSSAAYFGVQLRRAGVDVRELRTLLPNGDRTEITELAARLGISLRETASMLYDIRSCEGHGDRYRYDRWVGTLLNYKKLEAPRWVLPSYCVNCYDRTQWRAYAGAYTRAKPGPSKEIDDYFPDRTLNQPIGWEVTPGPGLDFPDPEAYLTAFMALHDERRQNDQRNFAYLVDRYIGADGNPQACLRSLLLGYLKTGEVIVGGNCFGCSVCVPDLNFEHYSVEQRKRAVVHLKLETHSLLGELERCNQHPPSAELRDALLAAIGQENALGRSGTAYLDSWLARLIQDDAEHQGALWMRLWAFEQNLFPLASTDLITILTQLIQKTSDKSLLAELQRVVTYCLELPVYKERRLDLWQLAAQLAGKREAWAEEAQRWQQVLEAAPRGRKEDPQILLRLLDLYRRADRLNDAVQAANVARQLIRLSTITRQQAQIAYSILAKSWTWEEVEHELAQPRPYPELAVLGWPGLSTPAGRQKLIVWLVKQPAAFKQWPLATVHELRQRLATELEGSAGALLAFADRLLLSEDQTVLAATLLLQAWAAGATLSPAQLRILAANLLNLNEAETRQRLSARPEAAALLQALWQARGKADLLLRWLTCFPVGTLRQTSEEVLAAVWAEFMVSKAPLEEPLLHDLLVRLGATPDAGAVRLRQVITDRPDWAWLLFQAVLRHDDLPRGGMVKTLFPVLLSKNVAPYQAAIYLDALQGDRALYKDDVRMVACLDVWQMLQTDRKVWALLQQPRIEGSTLVPIAKKWLVHTKKPHRLDMLVIILQNVAARSRSTWMTPISLEFQALCTAGRFTEAQAILTRNPDLQIQGKSAADYLTTAQSQQTERQVEYEAEFKRLWAIMIAQC